MRDTAGGAGIAPGTWFLLVVVAGLGGGLAGAAAASLAGTGDTAATPVETQAVAAAIRELAVQVASLQTALAQDRAGAVTQSPSSPEAARVDGAGGQPAALVAPPDVATLLQSLVATLRDEAHAGSAAPPLVIPPADPARREKVFKLIEQDTATSTQAHLFWSEQSLLDAYGPPDQVSVLEGIGEKWLYVSGPVGPGSRYTQFTIHDGRVIQVWGQ